MSASPDRYLSVSTYNNIRQWRVINSFGAPECADCDFDRVMLFWNARHLQAPTWPVGKPIPVWDGDEGRWGVLATAHRGMVLHDDDE